jgi:hypothetical protein
MAENMSAQFFQWLGARGINALVIDRGRVNEIKLRRIERLASAAKLAVLTPARPHGLNGQEIETAAPDAVIGRACRKAGLRTCSIFAPSVAAALASPLLTPRDSSSSVCAHRETWLTCRRRLPEAPAPGDAGTQGPGEGATSLTRVVALVDLTFEPVFDSTSWSDAIGRAQLATTPSPPRSPTAKSATTPASASSNSLYSTSYDWKFVPVAGASVTDSGTTSCH